MRTLYRMIVLTLVTASLMSCAPVLSRNIMSSGARNVPLSEIKRNADANMGRLFVFGGSIVETKVTPEGSMIEALYVHVDSRGYPEGIPSLGGRFLALFPKESGILDPVIYNKGKEFTVAGIFTGVREGKLGEMDYMFPVFRIREIYLWEERTDYYYNYPPYYYPYYSPYYYDPLYYDPFFRYRFYRPWW